jgi:hypothetical protein
MKVCKKGDGSLAFRDWDKGIVDPGMEDDSDQASALPFERCGS